MSLAARSCAGAALLAASVLADEVALMRVLSFAQWYHFGFLVVSCAMLAAAGAGIYRALVPARSDDPSAAALLAALLFAAQVPILHLVPLETTRLFQDPLQPLLFLLIVAVLSAPLFAVGIALTDLLSDPARPTHLIYGADLAGAAAGGALGILLLRFIGSTGVLAAAALLASIAALLLTSRRSRRGLALALAAGAMPLLLLADVQLAPYVTRTKVAGTEPAGEVLARRDLVLFRGEDGIAKVHVLKTLEGPRILFDAGTALTRVPLLGSGWREALPIRDELQQPFAHARGGRVLIIGSGGGWEVARALSHGASAVVAVEVSSVVTGYVKHHAPLPVRQMFADHRVTLVEDEARSYLERTPERFDAIVLIHTISNAAAASGALALAEDPLLTVEAVRTLADRLAPDGVLFITRPDAQLDALAHLVQGALQDEATGRIQLWSAPSMNGFLSALVLGPRSEPPAIAVERPLPAPHHARLPTDDRPYFHTLAREGWPGWAELGAVLGIGSKPSGDPARAARMALEELPGSLVMTMLVAALSLLALIAVSLLAGFGRSGLSAASRLGAALIGVGFMLIELPAVSRLTVLLGAPSLAFAAVAGALLLGAGLASALSGAPQLSRLREPWIAFLLASLGALALATSIPIAGAALLDARPVLRIAGVLAIVVPFGAPLGLAFPALLQRARTEAGPRGVAWIWTINGAASVLGGACSVLLSVPLGLQAALFIGASCYLLSSGLARSIHRR